MGRAPRNRASTGSSGFRLELELELDGIDGRSTDTWGIHMQLILVFAIVVGAWFLARRLKQPAADTAAATPQDAPIVASMPSAPGAPPTTIPSPPAPPAAAAQPVRPITFPPGYVPSNAERIEYALQTKALVDYTKEHPIAAVEIAPHVFVAPPSTGRLAPTETTPPPIGVVRYDKNGKMYVEIPRP